MKDSINFVEGLAISTWVVGNMWMLAGFVMMGLVGFFEGILAMILGFMFLVLYIRILSLNGER